MCDKKRAVKIQTEMEIIQYRNVIEILLDITNTLGRRVLLSDVLLMEVVVSLHI